MKPIINKYPTEPRRRFVFRVRLAADLATLVVGGVALGILLGNEGILIAIVATAFVHQGAGFLAERHWDRHVGAAKGDGSGG